MKVSVIVAHPNPASFNHAMARTVVTALRERRHRVFYHDLYAEGFDPLLCFSELKKFVRLPGKIRRHCDEIASTDGIVIIHPNWWGQPPAILKGWIDRVLRSGLAYEFRAGDKGEGIPVGLLKIKTAVVFNTSNTPVHRERKHFGDPLQRIWKRCIFDLCGAPKFYRKTYRVVVASSFVQRKSWLEDVRRIVKGKFPGKIADKTRRRFSRSVR